MIEYTSKIDPNHPQAMHLYIHAIETSPNPKKALEATNNLRFPAPGSGHLLHMPSYLYINLGHYQEGTMANERAVKIESAYVESCHAAGIYPWHIIPTISIF